jgi:hypothetical protein
MTGAELDEMIETANKNRADSNFLRAVGFSLLAARQC